MEDKNEYLEPLSKISKIIKKYNNHICKYRII